MSGFEWSAAGGVGAVLAVAALAPQARRSRDADFLVLVAAGLGASAATLAGHTAVAVVGWLGCAVAVCALHQGDERQASLAFLGDAVAIAALAALAVDRATADLPWAGGPPPPAWAVGMLAAGLATRAAFGSAVSSVPLVVGLTVAVRLTPSIPGDTEWLLLGAGAAVAAPWLVRPVAPGHVGALAVLGVAGWAPDHPAAAGAAALMLAGAGVLAAARDLGAEGAAIRVGAAGVAAGGTIGLLTVPLEANAVVAGAVLGAGAVAASVAVAPTRGGDALDPAMRRAGTALAVGAATVVLVPDVWWEAVGPPGGPVPVGDSVREALVHGRSGVLAALGLALAVVAAVAGGQHLRRART